MWRNTRAIDAVGRKVRIGHRQRLRDSLPDHNVDQRSTDERLQQGAKREAVMRYRYPLYVPTSSRCLVRVFLTLSYLDRKFEQVSAHRVPVGGMPDMSDLVIKP